ncbi:DUF4199 domain-containing protein [Echinicola jeungdonensis]|uniref:DUF4199 domain-containing protein n=1 Tax=Echinicola jeungdonensis TaxID=709343 RepID=A0ABV5J2F8_9BACT|nr:DUF4199 domain-containing protein [Echinicola jeungdonensis]MDN3668171.1 DUF4199 domain-containing protein [Echinicola jeungdonensis]
METYESPSRAALRTGLIIGLIMAAVTFVVYFANPTWLVSGWYGFIALVVFFALILYFGFQYRKFIGGYIDFGSAFQFSFITLIFTGIISIFFNILLYNVIDPSLPEVLAEQQLENAMVMIEKFGAADTMDSEQIDQMREGFLEGFSVWGQIKSFGLALIIYAILALILGAIIKKKEKTNS